MSAGGQVVADALVAHGVEHAFCVPGESYLAVLDGLYSHRDRLQVITCRHESGAAFMAMANARLTHRPGVCLVTRGPGACNASIALHVAQQGSVPLVVLVGQVTRVEIGMESFQEVDYEAFFAPLVKHVEQVDDARHLADAVARAFVLAATGRPGPIVVALPEDVLTDEVAVAGDNAPADIVAAVERAPAPADIDAIVAALTHAERPLIIAGGSDWADATGAALESFAAANAIPVVTAFRRHDLIDNAHVSFGGYLGIGVPAALWSRAAEADCVLVLGARLDEPTTNGYTLFRDDAVRRIVHVYPDADVIGRHCSVDHAIVADVAPAVAALAARGRVMHGDTSAWRDTFCAVWRESAVPAPMAGDGFDPADAMAVLNARLDDDAIVAIDAGNFSRWPQRCRRYCRPGRLLAPVNGAMGFGVPAAVGAALTYPDRQVVGCAGDGGMLMTGTELATAAQYGARPLILVFNNHRYGTIEMHQDRAYPERRIATRLDNPDFAVFARSFGLFGALATDADTFTDALDGALAAPTAALIDIRFDGY